MYVDKQKLNKMYCMYVCMYVCMYSEGGPQRFRHSHRFVRSEDAIRNTIQLAKGQGYIHSDLGNEKKSISVCMYACLSLCTYQCTTTFHVRVLPG